MSDSRYKQALANAKLTELQRKYLELYLDGHKIRTIARAHNVAPSTVREHIDAAIGNIRRHLQEDAA